MIATMNSVIVQPGSLGCGRGRRGNPHKQGINSQVKYVNKIQQDSTFVFPQFPSHAQGGLQGLTLCGQQELYIVLLYSYLIIPLALPVSPWFWVYSLTSLLQSRGCVHLCRTLSLLRIVISSWKMSFAQFVSFGTSSTLSSFPATNAVMRNEYVLWFSWLDQSLYPSFDSDRYWNLSWPALAQATTALLPKKNATEVDVFFVCLQHFVSSLSGRGNKKWSSLPRAAACLAYLGMIFHSESKSE